MTAGSSLDYWIEFNEDTKKEFSNNISGEDDNSKEVSFKMLEITKSSSRDDLKSMDRRIRELMPMFNAVLSWDYPDRLNINKRRQRDLIGIEE